MGITTLLELNHDMAFEIERDPQKFLDAVLEQMRIGSRLGAVPGGRIVASFGRWGGVADRDWEEWKRKHADNFIETARRDVKEMQDVLQRGPVKRDE